MSRIIFAFPQGGTHELWGTPASGKWAQGIGACVAIETTHLRYHAPGDAPMPAPVTLPASMVEAMDETMGVAA